MAWAEADAVRSEMAIYQSQLRMLDADGSEQTKPSERVTFLMLTGGRRKG
jgi:hypothetical protein